MTDGPKKYETEPTMPSVKVPLASKEVRAAFIETLEPTDEEREALLDAMRAQDREAVTMVPCPACKGCEFCFGSHMVDPSKAAAFEAQTVPGPRSSRPPTDPEPEAA